MQEQEKIELLQTIKKSRSKSKVEQAKMTLYDAHFKLICKIASSHGYDNCREDFISAGTEGFFIAVDRWDENKKGNCRFSSWAGTWILQKIQNERTMIKVGVKASRTTDKLKHLETIRVGDPHTFELITQTFQETYRVKDHSSFTKKDIVMHVLKNLSKKDQNVLIDFLDDLSNEEVMKKYGWIHKKTYATTRSYIFKKIRQGIKTQEKIREKEKN